MITNSIIALIHMILMGIHTDKHLLRNRLNYLLNTIKYAAYLPLCFLSGRTTAFEPVREKTNNLGYNHVILKPACTVT